LLASFPHIEEVVATTAPGTLLVLSSGPEDPDAWLRELRQLGAHERCEGRRARSPRPRNRGSDSAA
jgi:hypothetical protein